MGSEVSAELEEETAELEGAAGLGGAAELGGGAELEAAELASA